MTSNPTTSATTASDQLRTPHRGNQTPPDSARPAPGARHRDLRRLAEYLHLGKAALVLASAALGFLAHQAPDLWGTPTPQPPAAIAPAPSAAITSPADTAAPHEFALSGAYTNLPPGTLIWAITQDDSNLRYYPQDRPCTVTGDRFNCGTYYLGPDGPNTGGGTYTITIVAAPAAAVNTFIQYQLDKGGSTTAANPGLSTLPDGATVLTEKQLVRT